MKNGFVRQIQKILGAVGAISLLGFFSYEIVRTIIKQPHQKEILKTLTKEIAIIKPPSDAIIVDTQYVEFTDKTSISIDYSTSLADSEIQKFYYDQLVKNGWQLTKAEKVYDWGNDYGGLSTTYCKADLILDIQYAGAGARSFYKWAYGLFLKMK